MYIKSVCTNELLTSKFYEKTSKTNMYTMTSKMANSTSESLFVQLQFFVTGILHHDQDVILKKRKKMYKNI